MAQLVFTREYYGFNAYLNPSSKIGASCLRKSILQDAPAHSRHLSLDGGGSSRRLSRNPEETSQTAKDSTFTCSNFKKRKAQPDHDTTAPSIEIHRREAGHRLEQLNQRNRQLQRQLESQNAKMQSLRAKCEELEGKLQIYTNRSQLNSSFSTVQSHKQSPQGSHREQLKAIREKLRAINFSKIYQMINQPLKK